MIVKIFSLLLLVVLGDSARAQQPVGGALQEKAAAERRLVVYGVEPLNF